MVDLRVEENNLYYNTGELDFDYWLSIKDNNSILEDAIKVVLDKYKEKKILQSFLISSLILLDYKNINQDIYDKLVSIIYNNEVIARDFFSGIGTDSLLSLALANTNYKLNDEQKSFAINMVDTIFDKGSVIYGILCSSSWTSEEKQNLLLNFFNSLEEYDEFLENVLNEILDYMYLEYHVVIDESDINKIYDENIIKEIELYKFLESNRDYFELCMFKNKTEREIMLELNLYDYNLKK